MGVTNDESGESMEPMEEVPLIRSGESKMERLVRGWWREVGSWFQRREEGSILEGRCESCLYPDLQILKRLSGSWLLIHFLNRTISLKVRSQHVNWTEQHWTPRVFQSECPQRTNWLSTNRPSFAVIQSSRDACEQWTRRVNGSTNCCSVQFSSVRRRRRRR